MGRPQIIALVGIDGAGKTTLAKGLAQWLRHSGVPAKYFENPGGRMAIDRFARRLGRKNGIDLLGRRLFVAVEATVRWLAIARSLSWSRLTRRTVIMDRYSYCQYVVMRARGDGGERVARACYAMFPKPDLVCFISVRPQVAKARIDARGYDTEPLTYLSALDNAYRTLPEFAGFSVIDGNGTPEEVAAELKRVVAARSTLTGVRA